MQPNPHSNSLKVSVILPVYNGASTISETIQSVLNQSLDAFELIVINDGSTDNTLNIVQSFQDPRITLHSFPNAGLAASRNRGIRLATAHSIAFIDADDTWTVDKLAAQHRILQKCPQAALAYSWVEYIDENGNFLAPSNHFHFNGDAFPQLLAGNFLVSGSNPMVRSSAFEQTGLFNENLKAAEDWDMWLRIAERFEIVCVPKIQILYRRYPSAMSFDLERMERASLSVIANIYDTAPDHLQYLKRITLANTNIFLMSQALKAIPSVKNGLNAGSFYIKAARWNRKVLHLKPFLRSIFHILSMLLLPRRLFQKMSLRFPRIYNADAIYKYWNALVFPEDDSSFTACSCINRQHEAPLAVLDVDLSQIPDTIRTSPRFRHAQILFRYLGVPVGKAVLPMESGLIKRETLIRGLQVFEEDSLYRELAKNHLKPEPVESRNPDPLTIAVAVCTRGRPEILSTCLDHLMQLSHPPDTVMVIDNHPPDQKTRGLVEQYSDVQYLCENNIGLSHARNRALREAQTDLVAFIDDDAVPDPHWLETLRRNFSDPLVHCVTGLVLPLELETHAQIFFEQHCSFTRGFTRSMYYRQTISPGAVARIGVGTNMALRRLALIDGLGCFDTRFGAGGPLRSAEDLELFSRIISNGYRIVYDPGALVWHRHRTTMDQSARQLFDYGLGTYALWFSLLMKYGDLASLKHAEGWMRRSQLPALMRSLFSRSTEGTSMALAQQAAGSLLGPPAFLLASIKHRIKAESS